MAKSLGVGILLLLVCATTHATTVVQVGNTVTDINGLDIGGTLYDVMFRFVTDHSLPSGGDIFQAPISDSDGASAAAQAINNAINTLSTASRVGLPGEETGGFVVPYLFDTGVACDDLCVKKGDYLLQGVWSFSSGSIFPETNTTFARFTEVSSSVPVPSAVYLFGSGLIGLAGMARRRRRGVA